MTRYDLDETAPFSHTRIVGVLIPQAYTGPRVLHLHLPVLTSEDL